MGSDHRIEYSNRVKWYRETWIVLVYGEHEMEAELN